MTEFTGHIHRTRARLRDDSGFTLIELMVAVAILATVLTAVLALLDSSNQVEANDQERNVTLNEQTTALHRMTQELRQAYQVLYPASGSSSNKFDVLVRLTRGGVPTELRVIYDCSGAAVLSTGLYQCIRYEGPATDLTSGYSTDPNFKSQVVIPLLVNGGTSTDYVFTGLANPNDSSWATDGNGPSYAQVTIKTPSRGQRKVGYSSTIQLNDSVYMANTDLAH